MLQLYNLHINLNQANKEIPLYQQLVDSIKSLIKNGTLKEGEVLPGSRSMAQELGVSRKTVVTAMERLCFSGWLINKDRVGIFVAPRSNRDHKESNSFSPKNTTGTDIPSLMPNKVFEVDDGFPDTQLAPFQEVARSYRNFFNRDAKWKMLGYSSPLGYERLRGAISQGINHSWGLKSSEDEICITRGSQMALFLVANSLLQKGDTIFTENPCYERAYNTFIQAGLNVIKVDIDTDGIRTSDLQHLLNACNAKAIYLTPRHQYPTTVSLSMERREELVRISKEHGLLVIEDDYGCDFEFIPSKMPVLSSLLPKKQHIYISSYSKIIAPAVRLGYIATSKDNAKRLSDYRQLIDIQGDRVMEQSIFELISNGDIKRHIKRATITYHTRLQELTKLIRKYLTGLVEYTEPTGGLAAWLGIKRQCTAEEISTLLYNKGISVPTFTLPNGKIGLRIGYADLTRDEAERVISTIKKALE